MTDDAFENGLGGDHLQFWSDNGVPFQELLDLGIVADGIGGGITATLVVEAGPGQLQMRKDHDALGLGAAEGPCDITCEQDQPGAGEHDRNDGRERATRIPENIPESEFAILDTNHAVESGSV